MLPLLPSAQVCLTSNKVFSKVTIKEQQHGDSSSEVSKVHEVLVCSTSADLTANFMFNSSIEHCSYTAETVSIVFIIFLSLLMQISAL